MWEDKAHPKIYLLGGTEMKIILEKDEVIEIIKQYAKAYFDEGVEVDIPRGWELPYEVEITEKKEESEDESDQ